MVLGDDLLRGKYAVLDDLVQLTERVCTLSSVGRGQSDQHREVAHVGRQQLRVEDECRRGDQVVRCVDGC